MKTEMKGHVQIIVSLFTLTSVFVSGANLLGFGVSLTFYIEDDYNNAVAQDITLFNTEIDTSDYPNIISFHLYTNERWNDSVQLYIGDKESLKVGQFDPKKPTVFITHGWFNSYRSAACVYVRDAFFRQGDYNIILIDWSPISSRLNLYWVSAEVEKVAKFVSGMLDFLESQGMDPSTTTFVGHSFGAHMAGLASYYAKRKVNYVVGCDPAGPTFRDKGVGTRLSPEDANYVQAIHTSGMYGLQQPVGHSDFYVNGAIEQPGCIIPGACAHSRSYEYFAESINTKSFVGEKCDNYANYKLGLCKLHQSTYMGGPVPNYNAKGIYQISTNAKPPFAKN